MAQTVSQPRPAAVAAVLARSHKWTAARRKSDGRSFFYVPGDTLGAMYMADATGCTCPDARERQRVCKHSLAVAQYLARCAPQTDAELLAQLKADHIAQQRVLHLVGWMPDEYLENRQYAERAEQIARLETRVTVA